jgi:ribosomal protein S12 methylthiotransferase
MAIQQEISGELMQQKVGQRLRVVIDREEGDYYVGRTEQDSPEVDCEVLIPVESRKSKVKSGDFVEVEIVRAEEFDLYAILC